MGRSPNDLVGHARDPVTLVLHVREGQTAETGDGREDGEQPPVALGRE